MICEARMASGATVLPYQLPALPLLSLSEISDSEANGFVQAWGHYLGPCHRPFGQRGYLLAAGEPLAVAISASAVSATVAGYERGQVVELARLCVRPGTPWATRVMIRLWRELCAPAWGYWPVKAAISYAQNDRHEGRVYRFDGWRKVTDQAGSSGGGAWSRPRYANDAVYGRKTLWLWEYPQPPSPCPSLGPGSVA